MLQKTGFLRILSLRLPAGQVKMGPPVGTILGQFGVKIKQFCDEFNKKTEKLPKGTLINAEIYIKKDKSFEVKIKNVPTNFLIQVASLKRDDIITFLDLYKIYLINKQTHKGTNISNILGYLKTNNLSLINE